jgi:hypothetical protein
MICMLFLAMSAPPDLVSTVAQRVIFGVLIAFQLFMSLYLAGYWLYGPKVFPFPFYLVYSQASSYFFQLKLSMASIQVLYLMAVVGWFLLGSLAGMRKFVGVCLCVAYDGEWDPYF